MGDRVADTVMECELIVIEQTGHLTEGERRQAYIALAASLQEQARHIVSG